MRSIRNLKSIFLLAVVAGAWISLMGATSGGCGGPVLCEYKGKNYGVGQSFPSADGCNTCKCDSNGQIACTEKACVKTCKYDGKEYKVGATFPAKDGCNTCSCSASGVATCTKKACPTKPKVCGTRGGVRCAKGEFCDYSNKGQYQCGETDGGGVCKPKPSACPKNIDPVCGCNGQTYNNACEAHAAGVSVKSKGKCTTKPPTGTCAYNGKKYKVGETYPATDSCNKCTCQADGQSACTKKACATACGGRGGVKCNKSEFCDYSNKGQYQCGETDGTGVCKPKPTKCKEDLKPVCGCDGKTYSNECKAHAAGASVKLQGPCKSIPNPICTYNGKDYKVGETYLAKDGCNKCTCQADGQSACTKKACATVCGGRGGAKCSKSEFCDYSNKGQYQCGETDGTGVCKPKPSACPENIDPVCGCNGKTYNNACEAHAAGVSVKSKGKCTTKPPLTKCKDDCDCISIGLLCGSNNTCQPLKRMSFCPTCGSKGCKPGKRCYDYRTKKIGICTSTIKHCGGLAGLMCAKSEFCDYSNPGKYQCGETDATGVCKPKPGACPKNIDPVCGCNGQTYNNACEANAAGVSVKSKGKCIIKPPLLKCKDDCDCMAAGLLCGSNNTCQPLKRMSFCPTCGTSNCKPGKRCYDYKAKKVGICATTSKACGTRGGIICPKGEYCNFSNSTITYQCGETGLGGTCAKRPPACPLNYAPVCGCNGKTYGNACLAASAGISVKSKGPCKAIKKSCKYNGKIYPHQASFPAGDGCNKCSCDDGKVLCTKIACPPIKCKSDCDCMKVGKVCHLGTCQALRRMNTCPQCGSKACKPGASCYEKDGSIGICKHVAKSCLIHGQVIPSGQSIFDGCNTCSCTNGTFVCTKRACPNMCGIAGGKICKRGEFCARPDGKCYYAGTCKKRPTACPKIYKPVCGCDRIVYGNVCGANSAGQSVLNNGVCK